MRIRTWKTRPACCVTFLTCLSLAAFALAGESGARTEMKELAYRQQFVRQKFKQLTSSMLKVAKLLEESDPVSARAIRQAVAEAQRSDVAGNMGQVVGHLSKGLAAMAGKAETKVLKDLQTVLKLLQSGTPKPEDMDPLKAILKKLKGLLREQEGHVRDGGRTDAELNERKGKQEGTADRAREVSREMKRAAQPGQPTPGQRPVDAAIGAMERAIGQLSRRRPRQAHKSQTEAAGHLKDAVEEITGVIDRIKQTVKEQALADIERMLREVLQVQRRITKATAQTHASRSDGRYLRKQVLKLLELSKGEGALAGKVGQVLSAVRKDGTTVVFPAVVREVRSDLSDVQNRLAERKAGPATQTVQKQIEKSLESMIAALGNHPRRRQKPHTDPPPDDRTLPPPLPPRLVSLVAELKMLRTLQAQIHTRTLALDASTRSGQVPEAELKAQHAEVARREAELANMTRGLRGKATRARTTPPR